MHTDELNKKLRCLREKERRARQKREREEDDENEEAANIDSWKKESLLPHLKPATAEDYTRWLRGYMERGGSITHCYDYDLLPDEFYVAQSDFALIPLYGVDAVHIIVPHGVRFLGGELGHCTLYFEDEVKGHRWVPLYNNISF